MPRFEKKIESSSHISIAYGSDDALGGVFLSVYDDRLKYDENASKEVNQVTELVGVCDGGGSYFDLHTCRSGSGHKVSNETMTVYLKRFGATDEEISVLMIPTCQVCKKSTKSSCAKCHCVYYCSKSCQAKDWTIHKLFCKSLPFPKKEINERCVYGVFLAENALLPEIVKIRIETEYCDGGETSFNSLQQKQFLGDECPENSYFPRNPLKPEKTFSDTLCITYRDNFGNDGSVSNKVIQTFDAFRQPGLRVFDWRGPILVSKIEGTSLDDISRPEYVDIDIGDFENIIDFFMWYGSGR